VRHTRTLLRDRNITLVDSKHVYPIDRNESLGLADIYNAGTNKRLSRMRWASMVQISTQWWRTTATTGPTSWAPLGTNYFVLYPAASSTAVTLTLREQQRPAKLNAESDTLELPFEHHPKLLDLVEAILLLRHREDSLVPALDLLEASYGEG
jgi:hypothetical protein